MTLRPLEEALERGTLVPFIGAGVSVASGGLPGAGDIARQIGVRLQQLGYPAEGERPFPEACFLLKTLASRRELEMLLIRALDRPGVDPTAAHMKLASTPFPVYLTTNYDDLLEKALQQARRPYQVIVSDKDLGGLRSGHVPVIKLHGSLRRPETIIAAEDEYVPLAERAPILEGWLKGLLAQRSALFVGFGLADWDFRLLLGQTRRLLGQDMPRSFAVARKPDAYFRRYWSAQQMEVIEEDLNVVLGRLLLYSTGGADDQSLQATDGSLNEIEYLQGLQDIRSRPSETQAIDEFLDRLKRELQLYELPVALGRADRGLKQIIEAKPNFRALPGSLQPLLDAMRGISEIAEAQDLVNRELQTRRRLGEDVSKHWDQVVRSQGQYLLYSQSIRVLDLLRAVPAHTQAKCRLYVAECRPKSPKPFQDALAMCEKLRGTHYGITIVPDASIGHLIRKQQVQGVLLGAHAIYQQGEDRWFVNTCGSALIQAMASSWRATGSSRMPVFVVAELAKRVMLPSGMAPTADDHQEESLFDPIKNDLLDARAERREIQTLNVGYDLCPFDQGTFLVSEDGVSPPIAGS